MLPTSIYFNIYKLLNSLLLHIVDHLFSQYRQTNDMPIIP